MTTLATTPIAGKDVTAIDMLRARETAIDDILPQASGLTGAQLISIARFEVMRNDNLAECTPHSVMNAVYDSARLGLLLGREAHLVPFARHCTLIVDNRGFITAAMRSGAVTMIDADLVFAEDVFEVKKGSAMSLVHEPDYSIDRSNTKEILYAYAIAWLPGAPAPLFHVMNRIEIERIRASSKMKDQAPWRHWWDRMAMKSCIRFLIDKRIPITSVRLGDLLEIDNRSDTGKVTRPMAGEDATVLEQQIDQETVARQEELAMKLKEERKRQAQDKDAEG